MTTSNGNSDRDNGMDAFHRRARRVRLHELEAAFDESERSQRQQRRLDAAANKRLASQAEPAVNSLIFMGSCAVAALPGADISAFKKGVAVHRMISGNVLWFDAQHYVQGNQTNDIREEEFSQQVVDLRREDGFSVIGFTGLGFGPNSGNGNDGIFGRVVDLIYEHRGTNNPNRYLGIIGIGQPDEEHLPRYDCSRTSGEEVAFLDLLQAQYILNPSGLITPAPVHVLPPRPDVGPTDITNLGTGNNMHAPITMDFGGRQLP